MSSILTTAAPLLGAGFLTLHDLAGHGLARHRVPRLIAQGALIRLRNGRYARAGLHPDIERAGRLGGRLDCVSLLAALGVFVRLTHGLHLQFEPGTTRLPLRPNGTVAHWRTTRRERRMLVADLVEALAQACRCQSPRDAVATLDNAWHIGLVDGADIAAVFQRLPRSKQVLRMLLDRRSESGAETLVRLMLRALGVAFEVQVDIDGVGRVDFVVDGWLIVECDSRAHHEGWMQQKRDRRRDMAAAALGYGTIRPIAEDIFDRPETVQRMIADAAGHGRARNSTDPARSSSAGRRKRA